MKLFNLYKMNNLKFSLLSILFLSVFCFTSCGDDDVEIINDEEVITNFTYTLVPDGGGDAVTLSFVDADGDGGGDPVITGGTLAANTVYNGTIALSNETTDPGEDITEEVKEEDDEHQFFFSSTINDITIAYTDFDADNNPLGLTTTLTTGNAGSGVLTIILKHEPMKFASGVSDGDITNAQGETDIKIDFDLTIQ